MNTSHLHRVGLRLRLPLVFLITLLQRTPAVRVVLMAENAFVSSPLGAVLKSAAAALASLGAVHSMAGATTYALTSTSASPVSATVGQSIGTISFGVTNTTDIGSWVLAGSLPPGLTLASSDGMASLSGPGVLDATRPGESGGTDYYGDPIMGTPGVTNTLPLLSGTPTQAGNYTFTLFARQGPLNLVAGPFSFTINVAAAAGGGGGTTTGPTFSTQPSAQSAGAGGSVTLNVAASGGPTFQWQRNGTAVSGSGSSLTLTNLQPENSGIYQAIATSGGTTTNSRGAIVGLSTNVKLVGPGTEFPDIVAPNKNVYDQILLSGSAAAVKPDDGQILRISFLDMNDDIVQVEVSGPGTLNLVLDGATGPVAPVKYNQSTTYMKGHAGIVITGATANTNVSVFSVGRATATNQALFRDDVTYDGFADIAFIAISSADGQFGGVRAANASIWNTKGLTGIYAPGVQFTGPVFVNDIDARDNATPVFSIGSGPDVRITGGDLSQSNGRAVQIDGITQLKFTAGSNSHGAVFNAQTNHGRLEQNGQDVSNQIVVQ